MKEVIKIRVAPKEETNGIDVEERESTKNCENLKAACIRWKKKVELFKTQANAIKYNEKLVEQKDTHAEHMLRPKSSDLTRGLGKIHDQNFYDK
ncbi:2226_t:CDS:2, partial [Gigaspora rosea]